ncbi:hypothetical protein GGI35DRAFT_136931 [Trichoderma velutinum]
MADYPQDISWDNSIPVGTGESYDTIMESHMTDYPQDINWSITPVDLGMGPELAFPDLVDDNFDEVENSSPVNFNDPSSDTDPAGKRQPGYRWCCDEWKKDDGNFKKHLKTHNKRVPCEADPPGRKLCPKLFAEPRDRNRHYWVSHKEYAKEHNIPKETCFCEPCQKSFARRDFLWRHIKKFHSKESEVKKGKRVIDDNHEMVEGEDEEYAWVCRLKNMINSKKH